MTTGVLLQKIVSAKSLMEFTHVFIDEVSTPLLGRSLFPEHSVGCHLCVPTTRVWSFLCTCECELSVLSLFFAFQNIGGKDCLLEQRSTGRLSPQIRSGTCFLWMRFYWAVSVTGSYAVGGAWVCVSAECSRSAGSPHCWRLLSSAHTQRQTLSNQGWQ